VTRAEFLASVAPIAVKVKVDGGVLFPSVSLAQILLETGGNLHDWHNLVGYKVGSGKLTPYWQGESISTKTWEVYDGVVDDNVTANWRSYKSIEDCLKDQALLFLNNSRYARVVKARSPQEQATALYLCGYATDPLYSKKIMDILNRGGYEKYDKEVEVMLDRIADLEAKSVETLKRVSALEDNSVMANIPSWSEAAVADAVQDGVVAIPEGGSSWKDVRGSYDFFRSLCIRHRDKLLKLKQK
jgi:hypothetical protein